LVEELVVGEPCETSDHQIIRFDANIAVGNKSNTVKKHDYFKADYRVIREHADAFQWESLIDIYSVGSICEGQVVERLWDKLKSDLIFLKDTHVRFKRKNKNKCKWVTRKVTQCRIEKKKAWDNYAVSGKTDANYEVYKEKLRQSVAENRRAKLDFERKLADNIKQDAKSFYAYANNKGLSGNKIGPLQDEQGCLVEEAC